MAVTTSGPSIRDAHESRGSRTAAPILQVKLRGGHQEIGMGKGNTWLSVMALSTEYDRVARLTPALASFLPLIPLTFALGGDS